MDAHTGLPQNEVADRHAKETRETFIFKIINNLLSMMRMVL